MDPSALTSSYVDLRPSHQFVMHLDSFEACQAKTKSFVTKACDSFTQVCKYHQLPFGQHNMYRKWLISLDHTFESSLPRDARGAKFKEILTLPYPRFGCLRMWMIVTQQVQANGCWINSTK